MVTQQKLQLKFRVMKITTELLTDFLNEQCNEQTKRAIKNWINEDSKNKAYFEELQFYWDCKSITSEKIVFDSDKALVELHKKKAASKKFQIRKLMRYAALIAILIATSITSFFVFIGDSNLILVKNNTNIDKVLNLEDGTKILLAQNGTISYPKNFSEHSRTIKLTGKAFFDVAKDKSRPFIITTSLTKTKVLGTSFRISENSSKTSITVESGIVEFMQIDDPGNKVRLVKGDMANYIAKQKVVLKGEQSGNHQLKIKHLSYQNEKLELICNDLKELYNIDIRMQGNHIPQLLMTATFEDLDLDHILESISFSLDLEIEKNKEYILLK